MVSADEDEWHYLGIRLYKANTGVSLTCRKQGLVQITLLHPERMSTLHAPESYRTSYCWQNFTQTHLWHTIQCATCTGSNATRPRERASSVDVCWQVKSSQVEAFNYKDMTCVVTNLQNKRLLGTREALQMPNRLCQGLSLHLLYQLDSNCYVTEQWVCNAAFTAELQTMANAVYTHECGQAVKTFFNQNSFGPERCRRFMSGFKFTKVLRHFP